MCRCEMWAAQKLFGDDKRVKMIGKVDAYDIDKLNVLKNTLFKHNERLIKIPCGQCVECRLKNSRDWANRCMLETKNHSDNYFITLTYAPEHLPIANKIDLSTGEVLPEESGTLKPKDLQDFMKRLRRHWEYKYGVTGIKFYACGEYGEQYARPHYHAIIFGLPIYDLKADHKSKKGNMNYTSDEIEKIWNKGRIAIGSVTWDSCAYTARYILKKITGKHSKELYEIIGKEKEFVRMSRNPGIAKDYYLKNKDKIYETDELFVNTNKGVKRVKPARYFDKLFDIDEPERMQSIKDNRQYMAELMEKSKWNNTDIDRNEALQNSYISKDLAYKSLKRKFEQSGAV